LTDESRRLRMRPKGIWQAGALLLTVAVALWARAGIGAAQAPVTISVIDVSGDLSSVRDIIENFKKTNPNRVKDVVYQRATAPELPAKIMAQQNAGRVDINLILTGQDSGSVLIQNGQLVKLFPQYEKELPKTELTDAARILQDEGEGYLLPSVVSNGGPVFIYNPDKVKAPPKSIDEFKAWVKANPKRFMYARPANSGPGRSSLSGISYILGVRNPKDPINGWDKSWAFLK